MIRILARARHCISEALITGNALRIEGGDYEIRGMGMRRRRGGGARGRCNPATAGNIPAYTGGYSFGRVLGLRRGFRGGNGPAAGQGRGVGRGYRWYPPAAGPDYSMDAAGEMEMLKAEADNLKKSLDAINKRIDGLKEKSAEVS